MGKLTQQLTVPISSISDRPWDFTVWWLVAIVFGLAGFWLPILLAWGAGGGSAGEIFRTFVGAGMLASFSVVLLADGIAAALSVAGGGSNYTAAGMRALVGSVAFLLALVQVGVLVKGSPHASVGFQLSLTVIAIVLASYLYCFRFRSWEKDVAEVKEQEDKEVESLGASAERKSADEGGTKL